MNAPSPQGTPPPPQTQPGTGSLPRPKNIDMLDFPELRWGMEEEVVASLRALYEHAEASAAQAIGWYIRAKSGKGLWSRTLRVAAILLTTLGGLAPVLASIGWLGGARGLLVGQLGYVFLGLAAAAVALDRFFGFSSGWMRYINTAQTLQRLLAEFRFDWAVFGVQLSGRAPDADQVQIMIQRVKEFVLAVNYEVAQETQVWIADFQSSLAEIERSARAQMERQQPGAIEVLVPGGADLPQGWTLTLDGAPIRSLRASRYLIGHVPPGLHRVTVRAVVGDRTREVSGGVQVEPGAVATVSLPLVSGPADGPTAEA
jgi:hypothetical protein